jgi:hypothetical protein
MSKGTGILTSNLRTCTVCGEHVGIHGPDHSECAKVRQEEHKAARRRASAKKLSERSIDYLCKLGGSDHADPNA